jgi:hypothetical protein
MTKSKIPQLKKVGFVLYVCLGLIAACQRADDQKPAASSPVPSVKAEAAFALRYDTQDGYPEKTWQLFDIIVDAQGQWHLNTEFPTELTVLDPPAAVKFRKTTLGPADALTFSEPKFHFQVPFMASAGNHAIKVKLAFAVCTPETCVPEERTVELSLHVTN